MRISILLLLSACTPATTPTINLPDRTSIGQAPAHYDPCVQSYTQKTDYPTIEEHICVSSNGNHSVQEYFDTARNYPCSWHLTQDDKVRCIPVSFDDYYADMEWGWSWGATGFVNFEHPNQCSKRMVRLEVDPFHHPRARYVGLEDHKGKVSVYEIGEEAHFSDVFNWYWSAEWEDWECTSLYPTDFNYPTLGKSFRWFYVGEKMDLAAFQER